MYLVLGSYENAISYCRGITQNAGFEFCFTYVSENEVFKEINRFIWESKHMHTRFKNKYKGSVIVDISQWCEKQPNLYFEKMMDNYESESSGDKYKKDLEDFYYEMLIVNAFAKQINVYPSEEQLKKLISDMAMDEECASEDIIEKYGEEYLTYIYTYDQVCAYLLENVLVDN